MLTGISSLPFSVSGGMSFPIALTTSSPIFPIRSGMNGSTTPLPSRNLSSPEMAFCGDAVHAGGTVQRDISSGDIAAAIRTRTVLAPESREACTRYIARHAVCGDVVLLMGARDPSLPGYARQVAAALS